MADWDGLRRELERDVEAPPFTRLRERRERRRQRRVVALACAVALVGTASGVAALGQRERHTPRTAAVGSPKDILALGDRMPASYAYKDFVVTDVDFVSADTGWAIGLRCADERCDVRTWRTDDGGASWQAGVPVARDVPRDSYRLQDPAGGGVRSLRMVDAHEGFAFNPDLYVTHDGARTWTRVPQPSKVTSLGVAGRSVWAFERGCSVDDDCDAVLRTGTLGPGFALADAVVPPTGGLPAILRRSDASHGYLVTFDGAAATLRRTADGGRTWSAAAHPCPTATAVALSAARGGLLLVCTTASGRQAYRATDAVATWRAVGALPARGTLTDLVSVSATTAYATFQEPAAVLVTTDGGVTWRPASGAATKAYGYANLDAADPAHVWAMGDAGVLWRTIDGRTWSRLALPPGSR